MPYYSKKDYRLLGYEVSNRQYKKYDAILLNKKTGREVRVPFGDKRYENFHDKTGLNKYPKLLHKDKERRRLYRIRHKKDLKDGYYSPGWFSYYILW